MQSLGALRSCSYSSVVSGGGNVASKVSEISAPSRELLRVIDVIDGVETNDRNAVRRNKLRWIVTNVMEKFPNRKFKGLHKSLKILNSDCALTDGDFSVVMGSIQRVIGYGGVYEDFIMSLFAVWDGAASVSDAAADIGITPEQWSSIIIVQGKIRDVNRAHNLVLNSHKFKYELSRSGREAIILEHKAKIKSMQPLLLLLMTLNHSNLNPEINADLDDFIEENNCGKRLCRRLKRAYYNALARECLKNLEIDPLNTFGSASDDIVYNIKKVPFSAIGELKIGDKIYRINENQEIGTKDSKI